MRARLRGLIAVVAGAVLVGSAYLAPAPAGAEAALLSYGWWYLPNQVPNNLVGPPAPPWVPSDGIYVAGTPAGPLAVGAVRYAGEGPGTLSLDLTANGQAGLPSVSACIALNNWDGTSSGRWEGRPQYDCANGVNGEVSDDGSKMVFTLDAKIQRVEGVYDLALVPTGAIPFSATFNAPKSGSLLVAGGAPEGSVDEGTANTEGGESFGDESAFFSSEGALAFSGSEFNAGGDPAAPAAESARPALAPVVVPTESVVDTLPLPEDRNQRIAAVAGLALMVLGAWWFGGRTVRPPRLLGSMAARAEALPVPVDQPQVRGIGRFARPRQ